MTGNAVAYLIALNNGRADVLLLLLYSTIHCLKRMIYGKLGGSQILVQLQRNIEPHQARDNPVK